MEKEVDLREQDVIGANPKPRQRRIDKPKNLLFGANPVPGKEHLAQTITGKTNMSDMLNSTVPGTDSASLYLSTPTLLKSQHYQGLLERCQQNAVEGLKLGGYEQVLAVCATRIAERVTPGDSKVLVGGTGK